MNQNWILSAFQRKDKWHEPKELQWNCCCLPPGTALGQGQPWGRGLRGKSSHCSPDFLQNQFLHVPGSTWIIFLWNFIRRLSKQMGNYQNKWDDVVSRVSPGKVKMLEVASAAAASGLGGLYSGCKDGRKSWSKDWWNTEQPGPF